MECNDGLARRDFLAAGIASAGAYLWPHQRQLTAAAQDPANSRQTLDRLLDSYRRHLETGLYAGSPGGGNHIPMTLIAAWRLGATAEQLAGYASQFNLRPDAKPIDLSRQRRVTRATWRDDLGRAGRLPFQRMFEDWARDVPIDTILEECVPVFANGLGGAFSHDLIRLAYGIDLGSVAEIVSALAGCAASHRPGPAYDASAEPVAPAELLATIVENTAALEIQPDGGNFGPIAFRLDQIYAASGFTKSLRPVRIPATDPMAQISELIMDVFTRTQDFTLLHTLTTCQAMRVVLPYAGDPSACLGAFWHSACAAMLTVRKVRRRIEQDGATPPKSEWPEVHAQALARNVQPLSRYEHTVKLVYSCWLEAKHYGRDRYLALACRELERPSSFV